MLSLLSRQLLINDPSFVNSFFFVIQRLSEIIMINHPRASVYDLTKLIAFCDIYVVKKYKCTFIDLNDNYSKHFRG
jgi:hypothetical protein